jgi:hypothetical protein
MADLIDCLMVSELKRRLEEDREKKTLMRALFDWLNRGPV